tara:strand:- start:924 stop:1262 length:339 start_codon:yes stop_codon:yes gene_type:complete
MSAWVLALALSAGYLMNKNMIMQTRLEEKVHEFNQSAAPADPGPATATIRAVQRTVPLEEKYQDVNLARLSNQRVQEIGAASDQASAAVAAYESQSLPEIQGVYLVRDNYGV